MKCDEDGGCSTLLACALLCTLARAVTIPDSVQPAFGAFNLVNMRRSSYLVLTLAQSVTPAELNDVKHDDMYYAVDSTRLSPDILPLYTTHGLNVSGMARLFARANPDLVKTLGLTRDTTTLGETERFQAHSYGSAADYFEAERVQLLDRTESFGAALPFAPFVTETSDADEASIADHAARIDDLFEGAAGSGRARILSAGADSERLCGSSCLLVSFRLTLPLFHVETRRVAVTQDRLVENLHLDCSNCSEALACDSVCRFGTHVLARSSFGGSILLLLVVGGAKTDKKRDDDATYRRCIAKRLDRQLLSVPFGSAFERTDCAERVAELFQRRPTMSFRVEVVGGVESARSELRRCIMDHFLKGADGECWRPAHRWLSTLPVEARLLLDAPQTRFAPLVSLVQLDNEATRSTALCSYRRLTAYLRSLSACPCVASHSLARQTEPLSACRRRDTIVRCSCAVRKRNCALTSPSPIAISMICVGLLFTYFRLVRTW